MISNRNIGTSLLMVLLCQFVLSTVDEVYLREYGVMAVSTYVWLFLDVLFIVVVSLSIWRLWTTDYRSRA